MTSEPIKVEAEIREMFQCVLYNKCMCMGQYYAEDDLEITVRADTIDDLRVRAAEAIMSNEMKPDRCYVNKANVLCYLNYVLHMEDLENSRFGSTKSNEFLRSVLESERYKELVEYEMQRAKEKEDQARAEYEASAKIQREQSFLRLKKEFEPDGL